VAAVRRAQDDGDGSDGSGGGCIVSEVAVPGVICGGVAAVSIVPCVRHGHERRGTGGAEDDDAGAAAVAAIGSAGAVAVPGGAAADTARRQQVQRRPQQRRRRLLLLLPSADPLHRLLLHHLCCCHGVHAFGVRVRRRGGDAVGVAEVVTAGPAGSGGKERAVAVLSPPEPCRAAADLGTAASSNSSRRAAVSHTLPLHHLYATNRAPVCAFLAQLSS
jgi:hypothetical protein